jgi:hypothetical protein
MNSLKRRGLLFWVAFLLCQIGHANELPPDFPPALMSLLAYEYPGWRLTPINTKLVARRNRGAYSNLLQYDMNRDGKMDYVMEINYIDNRNDVQTAAIAFISEGDSFHQYRLTDVWVGSDHAMTFEPSETVLRFVAKGQPGYRAGDEDAVAKSRSPAPIYRQDVIEVITLNQAVTALGFDGNGFNQVRKANTGQDRE